MKTRDLKSLSETIASVVDPIDKERAQMLQEGFLNSLTEKARQVASKEMEDEDEEEEEDEMEDEVELAEKAAPGYEDWASDPKVKASFKKQYGKRWQEVMYGHSWNLAKQEKKVGLDEEDLGLEEGYQAKRMRVIRKAIAKKDGQGLKPEVADFMKRSFKRKRRRDETLSGGRGAVGALETRAGKKTAAMKAKLAEEWGGGFQSYQDAQRQVQAGLRRDAAIDRKTKINDIKAVLAGKMSKNAFTKKHRTKFSEHPLTKKIIAAREKAKARRLAESMQLDEGKYKKLMRVKGAAYKAELAGNDEKRTRLRRAAAELTDKVAAGMARRGGASPEAVKGGGSGIGKRGKYTKKAGKLANMRDRAIAAFHGKARTAQLFDKGEDQSRKRERQQAQAAFEKKARTGDFGQDNQAAIRARSNFQKRFGRLKGK